MEWLYIEMLAARKFFVVYKSVLLWEKNINKKLARGKHIHVTSVICYKQIQLTIGICFNELKID